MQPPEKWFSNAGKTNKVRHSNARCPSSFWLFWVLSLFIEIQIVLRVSSNSWQSAREMLWKRQESRRTNGIWKKNPFLEISTSWWKIQENTKDIRKCSQASIQWPVTLQRHRKSICPSSFWKFVFWELSKSNVQNSRCPRLFGSLKCWAFSFKSHLSSVFLENVTDVMI